MTRTIPFVLALALGRVALAASPLADPAHGGAMEVFGDDGRVTALPLLRSEVVVELRGDLASVKLTQTFSNPGTVALHARYVFPLPPDAAVHGMTLRCGDEIIEARIRQEQEAKAEFEQAKREGRQAALLTQHRPNVFTQEVAHLMPGRPVEVEVRYVHPVPLEDGELVFHFPMVVGPRYLTANAPAAGEPAPLKLGAWNVPASAPVATGRAVDGSRVSLELQLDAGMPVRAIGSPTHAVDITAQGATRRTVRLAGSRTADDRDFELHYRLAGERAAVGVTTWADGKDGVVSLLVEPPAGLSNPDVTAREMIFLLDCSGSMSGVPLETSKRFMRRALLNLRPADAFRIIRFSDAATAFSSTALPATAPNIQRGLAYVGALSSEGGTEMTTGIRAALEPAALEGHLRIVTFLTDGYIGNDVEIVRLVQQKRGEARLFSFGVGAGVNRYLLDELARVGRGAARIVKDGENAEEAADLLANRLEAPYLTDIAVDWGTAAVRDATPVLVPDLFLGQSVRILARYDRPGTHRVVVRGRVGGRTVELPLELTLPAKNESAAALPITWARGQIEDRMQAYLSPALDDAARRKLQDDVTALGLKWGLVTQWTSFLAVSRAVVNPTGAAKNADVPVPPVHNVSPAAYSGGFAGSSAPEPATLAALAAMSAAAARAMRRRKTA